MELYLGGRGTLNLDSSQILEGREMKRGNSQCELPLVICDEAVTSFLAGLGRRRHRSWGGRGRNRGRHHAANRAARAGSRCSATAGHDRGAVAAAGAAV